MRNSGIDQVEYNPIIAPFRNPKNNLKARFCCTTLDVSNMKNFKHDNLDDSNEHDKLGYDA